MVESVSFDLSVRKVRSLLRWVISGGIALMALLHALFTWPEAGTFSPALVDMFHVDREHNVPTWFSSALIIVLAMILFAVAFHEAHTAKRRIAIAFWTVCGCVALFLSMDETAEIHEALGTVVGDAVRDAEVGTWTHSLVSFPSYYWPLIYIPLVVPFGTVFGLFAIREMVTSRVLAILGLVTYLFGAVVLDHLEGRYGNDAHERLSMNLGSTAFRFDIFLVEELCEMIGVFIIIEAVLRHWLWVGARSVGSKDTPASGAAP